VSDLATLYRHRQLIAALTARDLKARYRGSILGYFWSLANPLLLLAVYTIVFTKFFPARLDIEPYPLFLFTGILPWTVKKVMFPAEALPLVVVLSHLVHFALAIPVMLAALVAFTLAGKAAVTATILLVPLLMVLQTMFIVGLAMTVSSASVLFRDLRDIVANLLQLGFFITPIIYPIEEITYRPFRALLRLNPMTPFVVSYQNLLFYGRLPNLSDTILMICYAVGSLIIGFFVFDRLRDTLAEAI
jgi:lipopolysaccharide transport system permease protein